MTARNVQTSETLSRILRAPVFLLGLALSFIPVFFIFAWVSVGAWWEEVLLAIGLHVKTGWLPAILGMISYVGLGIVGPALLGKWLLGWGGAVIFPMLMLIVIAILDRW